MANPLENLPVTLLVQLGSAIVHADEFLSADRHEYDLVALRGLIDDPEVKAWLAEMSRLAMLPVKRRK